MKIAVIGAGLVGLASAHALADEGHSVVIIDREGPAAGASRGNAGWLAHTDIDPIAHPKMLRQVPKFLMDPLGPLAIRREYLLPILPWLVRLLIASRPANLARSIEALIALQSLAMPAWTQLSARLGMEKMIHRRGGLFAFETHDAFREAMPHFKRQEAAGIRVEYLDGPELRQMEPAFTDAIAGGAYFPDAGHVSDPHLVTLALYEAARAYDAGEDVSTLGAMSKLFTSEVSHFAANEAVQIWGGMGYCKPTTVERLYRDQRILEIYEGSSEIQRLVLSRAIRKDVQDQGA